MGVRASVDVNVLLTENGTEGMQGIIEELEEIEEIDRAAGSVPQNSVPAENYVTDQNTVRQPPNPSIGEESKVNDRNQSILIQENNNNIPNLLLDDRKSR